MKSILYSTQFINPLYVISNEQAENVFAFYMNIEITKKMLRDDTGLFALYC